MTTRPSVLKRIDVSRVVPQVRTVDAVDLDRYVGEWFEVSRFPNTFQRACVGGVRATYSKRSDGRVDVVNRCRTADGRMTKAQGIARIVDAGTSAKLKVRFAPAFLSFLPSAVRHRLTTSTRPSDRFE